MNHESVERKKRTQTGRDHTLHNMRKCILIVLSVSILILTSIGPAHAQPATSATLTLTPSSVAVGTSTTVKLSGAGYAPSTDYGWCVSTTNFNPGSQFGGTTCVDQFSGPPFSTDPSGNIPSGVTFAVFPPTLKPGTYYVVVWNPPSPTPTQTIEVVAASASFTVTTSPPGHGPVSLSISPTSAPAGTPVTLSGIGYTPSATYCYCLSASSSSVSCVSGTPDPTPTFMADGSGNIPSGTSLTVPSGTTPGSYFIIVCPAVWAGGCSSHIAAYAPFTVTTGPGPQCSTWRVQIVVSTSEPVYSVGDHIIVSWSPQPSIPGELTLTGPSGTYNYNLDQGAMSQGMLDVGTAEQKDVGSWTATLTVFGAGECPSNYLPGQTGFQVKSGPTMSTSVTTMTAVSTTTSSLPFDYSITVSPSTQSVEIGGSTSYVVSVVPVAGSPVPVSLTVMGCPGDVRSSFTTQSAVPPFTSTLNLDLTTSSANAGAYTLSVVGTAAGNMKSATATLVIQQKPAQATVSTVASTTTTPPSPAPEQNTLIMVVAVVALAAVLGVLAMRGRGRHVVAVPRQVGAAPVFCGKCGTENPASNAFCVTCGNKLKSS
jgi:hypothetical protein